MKIWQNFREKTVKKVHRERPFLTGFYGLSLCAFFDGFDRQNDAKTLCPQRGFRVILTVTLGSFFGFFSSF